MGLVLFKVRVEPGLRSGQNVSWWLVQVCAGEEAHRGRCGSMGAGQKVSWWAEGHIVKDVDRCVQGLGDEEEVVEHDARPVRMVVLSRWLNLNAILVDVEAVDGESALGLDREPDVHSRPVPTNRAHHAGGVGSILADWVVVDELKATAGPGRERRGVERVCLEDHAELRGWG